VGERREENREGKKAANPIVMPYSREHLLRALDTGAVGGCCTPRPGWWDTDSVLG